MGLDTDRQCEKNESQFHSNCNLKLALFAFWCCVAPLLLHTVSFAEYDGIETVLDEKARQMLIKEVDDELEIRIQEYMKHPEFKDRARRNALFETAGEEENLEEPLKTYVQFFNSTSKVNKTIFEVFLTPNALINLFVLADFCKETQDYCPPGEVGPIGPFGYPGPVGDVGNNGEPGARGERGSMGTEGPRGLKGFKGEQGDIGIFGIRGAVGHEGQEGEKGEIGAAGVKGSIGSPGLSGLQGPAGIKGDRGFYRRSILNDRNF